MSDEHALAAIASDLVTAGISPLVAPTAAREALSRVRRGEAGPAVIRDVASDWLAIPSLPPESQPVPAPPAARQKVLATVGGAIRLRAAS